jgi:hypothetical protein
MSMPTPALPQRLDPATRVPVQWLGRARLLRSRIMAAYDEWAAAGDRLLAPLRRRDDFVPVYTRQTLSVTLARWKRLPVWGQIRCITRQDRAALSILEFRLAPLVTQRVGWDADELTVALALISVDLRLPAAFIDQVEVVACISLHALGRRFERSVRRDDISVLRDLVPIPSATMRADGDFAVPAYHGGQWIGQAMTCNGKPILAVRTFLGD